MKISVIIPIYNEASVIADCLLSLSKQTVPIEIILVDDGSTDDSVKIVSNFKFHPFDKLRTRISNFKLIKQGHLGPGAARNTGAQKAGGDILVFVDADMTFASDFIEKLTAPIIEKKSNGTFTKEEFVSNWDQVWARCWNYNEGLQDNRRIPKTYPDTAPVFRAIARSEFLRVGGFTTGVGWTDDWTLAKKLGYRATVTHAKCFHRNPQKLDEVWRQARWIGKNTFLSGSFPAVVLNLIRYNLFFALLLGLYKSVARVTPQFVVFKLVYNLAITVSLLEVQFFAAHRNR